MDDFKQLKLVEDYPGFKLTSRYRSLFKEISPELVFECGGDLESKQVSKLFMEMRDRTSTDFKTYITEWEYQELVKYLQICLINDYKISFS